MIANYRIYDSTDRNTLASGIPTEEAAQEILELLKRDFPHNSLEIEKYTRYTDERR